MNVHAIHNRYFDDVDEALRSHPNKERYTVTGALEQVLVLWKEGHQIIPVQKRRILP